MLSISHLTKYYGRLKAVDDLSFELQPERLLACSGLAITLGFFLHFHLIVQGVMVILINAVCISVLIILAAKKYESFNPIE